MNINLLIHVKMANECAKSHGGMLPLTREEKKEFIVFIIYSFTLKFLFINPCFDILR